MINAGNGVNTIDVAPTSGTLASLASGLIVTAGGRTEVMINDRNGLAGSGRAGNTYTVSDVAGTTLVQKSNLIASVSFQGTGGVTLFGDIHEDTYDVESTGAAREVTLYPGEGTNTVTVSPNNQGLADLQGHLTVHGLTGQGTTVLLNDQKGTGGPGTYTLSRRFPNLLFQSGPVAVSTVSVSGLTINGSPGDDTYNVEDTIAGTPVTLFTGFGHNTVNVALTAQTLTSLGALLTVNGSGLTDLVLNDQKAVAGPNSPPSTYTVSNSRGGTLVQKSGLLDMVNYFATGRVTLNGQGNSTYNVESTVVGNPVTINTTAGSATVNVTPASQNLTASLGADLTVFGGAGHTTVTLNDQHVVKTDSYTIKPDGTTVGDPVTVNYKNITALVINGAAGGGSYDVQGLPPGATLTINLGTGPNTLRIAPGIRSGLTISGVGHGPLTIDDSTDTANATYTITPTTVQVSGSPPITYTGAPSLTVLGGSGADTFNV
jgi:hypothetical protein